MADPTDPLQEGGDPQDPPAGDPPAGDPTEDPPADPPKAREDPRIADLRKESAGYRTRLRAAEAEIETLKANGATELEQAVAGARAEARQEALTEANARLVEAEVLAGAAGKFANPALAVKIIDTTGALRDDGSIDKALIASSIEAALKENPGLAVARDPDFGARPPAERDASGDMNAWMRQAAGKQ